MTGSSAGIGFGIARRLAQEGAIVYVNGRTEVRVSEAIAKIRKEFPNASLVSAVADFSNLNQVQNLIESIHSLDILVNNLGVFEPVDFVKITDEAWTEILDMNLMSGVRLSRAFFPGMIDRNWGRILFISSESGVQIPSEMVHYGVSKAAQIALANGMAKLTKATGVTVNSVLPGSTWSEGAEIFMNELAKEKGKTAEQVTRAYFETQRPDCLLQRFATLDEVADFVCFLASPLAAAVNGAALRVDGGTVPTML